MQSHEKELLDILRPKVLITDLQGRRMNNFLLLSLHLLTMPLDYSPRV